MTTEELIQEQIDFWIEIYGIERAKTLIEIEYNDNDLLVAKKHLKFYSVNEISRQLNITRSSVYNYMNDGKINYIQIKKHKRIITQGQLNNFLQSFDRENYSIRKDKNVKKPSFKKERGL